MKVGILGAGYSGKMIGKRFADVPIDVWGTSRHEGNFSSLEKLGVKPVLFDGVNLSETMLTELIDTTHLIISIAPPRQENLNEPDALVDPTLISIADHPLKSIGPNLKWIGYLSTVGVYGNHDGAWVDEATPASPASERSRQRVRAEDEWLSVGRDQDIAVGIFRLSGIYGPGRNALINADQGKSRRMVKPGQVFNRIHVLDIAEALYLAAQKNAKGLFNITDDEPAPPQDVVTHAHSLLGTPPPEEIDFETADISPMARSFYGENKRVSNEKSKNVLGLDYVYGNYRDALTKMHGEGNW